MHSARRIFDDEGRAQFLTFSCCKRRKLLSPDRAKRIVIGSLQQALKKYLGGCLGFVVMPDHVHALIWFGEKGQMTRFLDLWKSQSSHEIKLLFRAKHAEYWQQVSGEDSVWQDRYHALSMRDERHIERKLDYIHLNPVKAGFVERAIDWRWSSARWYVEQKSVGIPIQWPQ